jgi:hypothetical protein
MALSLPPDARPSRETRLLFVVIVVSLAALALLSRLRFPDAVSSNRPVGVGNPLDRLAARATFDDITSGFDRAREQVEQAFEVLRIESTPASADGRRPVHHVPALRIRDSLAVVPWPVGFGEQVVALATTGTLLREVVPDSTRGLAVIGLPAEPARTLSLYSGAISALVPRYVAAVEAGRAGLVVRPMFLAAASPVPDPAWGRMVDEVEGSPPSDGAFLFSVDGQFLGLLVRSAGRALLLAAPAVFAEAEQLLARGALVPGDLGVELQELTDALRLATGASQGVVVSYVAPDGPSASVLRPGDVVVSVNGVGTPSIADLRLQETRAAPGAEASLTLTRSGEQVVVGITPRARVSRQSAQAAASSNELGLTARTVRAAGAEVQSVTPGSLAWASGIGAGDLITRAGDVATPTSADVTRVWAELLSRDSLIVAASRDGRHFVTAIRKP